MSMSRGQKGEKGDPGVLPPAIVRRLRLQALVTFLIVAIFCICTAYWQSTQTSGLRRAQRAAFVECQAIEAGHVQFNKVLDQLARNAKASTALTPEQKLQALTTYASIHLPILDCSGLAP